MTSGKPNLNIVVLGQCGSGKSTLIGQLLQHLGHVEESKMAEVKRMAKEAGQENMKHAWLVTDTPSERERGLTIDVHARTFETSRYHVTILDVPGHRDFIKNTIAGIAEADCAILLVSNTKEEYRKNMRDDGSGMVPEHALLAYTFGLTELIVCVNKMDDESAKYSEDRFDKIRKAVQKHLNKISYKLEDVPFLPISGQNAENLFEKSPNMPWWDGSKVIRNTGKVRVTTLTEAIDAMTVPAERVKLRRKSLRIPIRSMHIINDKPVAVGRIETGYLKPGSRVTFGPITGSATVTSVEKHHKSVDVACPGDLVGFMLETDCAHVNRGRHGLLRRGQVCTLVEAREPMKLVREFIAQIVILEHPKGVVHEGYAPIIDLHTSHVQCQMKHFLQKLDRLSGKVLQENPKELVIGDAANVRVVTSRPICAEVFRKYPKLGRFSIRDLSRVIGVGVIKQLTDYEYVKAGKDGDGEQVGGDEDDDEQTDGQTTEPTKVPEIRVQRDASA